MWDGGGLGLGGGGGGFGEGGTTSGTHGAQPEHAAREHLFSQERGPFSHVSSQSATGGGEGQANSYSAGLGMVASRPRSEEHSPSSLAACTVTAYTTPHWTPDVPAVSLKETREYAFDAATARSSIGSTPASSAVSRAVNSVAYGPYWLGRTVSVSVLSEANQPDALAGHCGGAISLMSQPESRFSKCLMG